MKTDNSKLVKTTKFDDNALSSHPSKSETSSQPTSDPLNSSFKVSKKITLTWNSINVYAPKSNSNFLKQLILKDHNSSITNDKHIIKESNSIKIETLSFKDSVFIFFFHLKI